jgi:basic amino acid/polyamine antiporter, APA family
VASIFVTVIATHEIGRIAGPAWMLLCVGYYFFYRHRNGLPLLGNIKHDWEAEQMDVLTRAEEYDLLEEYKQALVRRDRKRGIRSRWEPARGEILSTFSLYSVTRPDANDSPPPVR